MRPRGSYGQVAAALCASAPRCLSAPASVREMACAAQVGFAVAAYTASRLVDAGELVVVDASRPRRLVHRSAVPAAAPVEAQPAVERLSRALRSFWECDGAA